MEHFADRGRAVGQHRDLVFFGALREGGMGDAVLGHHAADQQFLDPEPGEYLFQRGAVEAVGVFLDHHRGIRCGGEDLGVDAGAGCPGVEEGGDALGGVGDVLHVDDRDASGARLADCGDDVAQGSIGVPQRKQPAGEVVVLQVDDDQGAFWRCGHWRSPSLVDVKGLLPGADALTSGPDTKVR